VLHTVRCVNEKDCAGCSRELPHGGEKLTWVSCDILYLRLCRVQIQSRPALSMDGGTYEKEEGS